VVRVFNRRNVGNGRNSTYTRNRHQTLHSLALPRHHEQLAIKSGRAPAYVAPGIQQGQYDPRQVVITIQQCPHVAVEHTASSLGDDETPR